jgi:hypothetical protein
MRHLLSRRKHPFACRILYSHHYETASGGQAVKDFSELQQETRTAQFDFLMTDIAVGQTFLNVAETTRNATTRKRNVKNANDAFASVSRLGERLVMTVPEGVEFREKLKELGDRIHSFEPWLGSTE